MRTSRAIFLVALAIGLLLIGAACDRQRETSFAETAQLTGGGDARAGVVAIRKYGCNGCHTIPGVRGTQGLVGPPLNNFAYRIYIAGQLPNTAPNLITWIRDPQKIQPHTAMPTMGVTEQDARDIAAYLYSLR
jgi:cytochrome c